MCESNDEVRKVLKVINKIIMWALISIIINLILLSIIIYVRTVQ